MKSRIGIYAGTFDPVHAGHIAFALQAVEHAKLDKVYFLPERRPRYKKGVEHFGHRVAMLRRAAAPHPKFEVLELNDASFSTERTLPGLERRFAGDRLVFLFGSDTVKRIAEWPKVERLLARSELVVGIRNHDSLMELERVADSWPAEPLAITVLSSHAPTVSSSKIREALRRRTHTDGSLSSVKRYSDRNWLYVSLADQAVDKP